MNTIAGAVIFASANRSLIRAAPSPTSTSTNSVAATEMNDAFASPATAFAISVLPQPGGPKSRTPFGICAPSFLKRSGSERNSTSSRRSCFASSCPATSSSVTRSSSPVDRRPTLRSRIARRFWRSGASSTRWSPRSSSACEIAGLRARAASSAASLITF